MCIDMIHAVARCTGAAIAIAEFHFRICTIGNAACGAAMERFIQNGLRRVLDHFAVTIADAIDNIAAEKDQEIQYSGNAKGNRVIVWRRQSGPDVSGVFVY